MANKVYGYGANYSYPGHTPGSGFHTDLYSDSSSSESYKTGKVGDMHESFPSMGKENRAHEGSQSTSPDKEQQ